MKSRLAEPLALQELARDWCAREARRHVHRGVRVGPWLGALAENEDVLEANRLAALLRERIGDTEESDSDAPPSQ